MLPWQQALGAVICLLIVLLLPQRFLSFVQAGQPAAF
jgi:hypothetical protein